MDATKFKIALLEEGYTQKRLAKELGMSEATIIRKVRNNGFTIAEAQKISRILNVQNPCEIFFAPKVN